jgi:hypothetical protein
MKSLEAPRASISRRSTDATGSEDLKMTGIPCDEGKASDQIDLVRRIISFASPIIQCCLTMPRISDSTLQHALDRERKIADYCRQQAKKLEELTETAARCSQEYERELKVGNSMARAKHRMAPCPLQSTTRPDMLVSF